jgi:glycosyltransferase involved in cell wall biosynthesis
MHSPARVIVAIPTFRRPKSLKRLLDALARIETTARVSVLVADNDAERHEGLDLCARVAPDYRWPLEAISAPERGLAQVRNALVEKALADPEIQFVAMIDDDEWPEAGWIDGLLEVQAETGADAVQGSILFQHDGAVTGGDGTSDIRHATGPVEMLQGAGNLLITRAALEQTPAPWFDAAFAFTGGEDRDFFMRLKRAGRRFAWADSARAQGEVAAVRLSVKWAMQRAFSIGNSDMRVFLKHGPAAASFAAEGAKIAGALLLSPLMLVILGVIPNRRSRWLARFFRAAGKLAAMFGAQYNEYALVHGE